MANKVISSTSNFRKSYFVTNLNFSWEEMWELMSHSDPLCQLLFQDVLPKTFSVQQLPCQPQTCPGDRTWAPLTRSLVRGPGFFSIQVTLLLQRALRDRGVPWPGQSGCLMYCLSCSPHCCIWREVITQFSWPLPIQPSTEAPLQVCLRWQSFTQQITKWIKAPGDTEP